MNKPMKIVVLALGGTIASVPTSDGGAIPQLSAEALVAAVLGLPQGVDLVAETFRMLPSPSLKLQDIVDLAARIREEIDKGANGIVVTQGTDTIEETSFTLDLLLAGIEEPVVMTGAMRHSGLAGPDGSANLAAAVAVAACSDGRGLGVLVVLNDTIHAARYIRKGHTSLPSAFISPTVGPLGYVSEGRPTIPFRLAPHDKWKGTITGPIPNDVLLVMMTLDDPGLWLELAGSDRVNGVVIAGLGGGHVPEWIADPLVEIAQKKPVILTSRVPSGEALIRTYGIKGGEIDLLKRGLLPGGWLDPAKARVLLRLLLSTGADNREIATAFQHLQ